MKTVGAILSEARKHRGYSLEEVEKATKIRKQILTALEESDWPNLPASTFIKGFIRNYGRYLGLEVDDLLAFFRREYDERKTQQDKFFGIKRPRFTITPTLAIIIFALLSLGGVVVYLYAQYQTFVSAPLLEIENPENNLKVTNPEVNVIGKTYPDATLKINGQKVEPTLGGTFSVSVSLSSGVNEITVTSENKFGKISKVTRSVSYEPPEIKKEVGPVKEVGEATASAQKKEGELELVLKIGPNSAWVKIEGDGKNTYEGILLQGATKTFKAKEYFKVSSGNAGSTQVIFNGQDQGLLGGNNQVVSKEFKR